MDVIEVIERFRGPLVGLLAAWGRGPQEAREVAHDSLVEAYLSRERFEGRWDDVAAVGAWIRGIARNVHRATLRRSGSRGSLRRLASLDALPDDALAMPAEPDEHPQAALLRRAIAGLREDWRTVLVMRYVEGASLEEIAALLGLGVRAVEGRLRRARIELKTRLEANLLAATSAPDGEASR